MYYRLMTRIDLEAIACNPILIDNVKLLEQMKEILDTLDFYYGPDRRVSSYGGYLFFIPSVDDVNSTVAKICDLYHLDEEAFEYDDVIATDSDGSKSWYQKLYLRSSEDSIVFVYPKES